MLTILFFLTTSYFVLKELNKKKQKFAQDRQDKIDRDIKSNELFEKNIRLQEELLAMKQAELLHSSKINHDSTAPAAEKPGYRVVTNKKQVLSARQQATH